MMAIPTIVDEASYGVSYENDTANSIDDTLITHFLFLQSSERLIMIINRIVAYIILRVSTGVFKLEIGDNSLGFVSRAF